MRTRRSSASPVSRSPKQTWVGSSDLSDAVLPAVPADWLGDIVVPSLSALHGTTAPDRWLPDFFGLAQLLLAQCHRGPYYAWHDGEIRVPEPCVDRPRRIADHGRLPTPELASPSLASTASGASSPTLSVGFNPASTMRAGLGVKGVDMHGARAAIFAPLTAQASVDTDRS